ncbi:MAG: hypothetical protein EPO26_06100 [Chloroflexota bacterium]|nr:MAG: hypothetical protein EPO26_06100 [Chloroflexota bacterium]
MIHQGATATINEELGWAAVSRPSPCPICAEGEGCMTAVFRGGLAVDCRNIVSAWPMVGGGWLHRQAADGHPDEPADCTDGANCAFPMPFAVLSQPYGDGQPLPRARG